MRSVLAAAALAAAALLTACGGADGSSPAAAATPAPPTLDAQLRGVVSAGAPGALALVNDGRSLRVHAAGDFGARDRFRAGSITKSFVATVALQLVGEGRLSLSDRVERWLPGVLPYGDRVTVRQLLNLTSGIPDNQDPVNAEFLQGNMTRSWTPRELVALVADKAPDFPAGHGWAYSNTNYTLAGMIIERVTGHRLGDELGRRILRPLGLDDTSFPVNATAMDEPHARGFAFLDGGRRDVTVLNPSGTWAAGNLVSTAADIARFWRALLGGRLLAPAQLKAMKTTVPAWDSPTLRYGLGIQRVPTVCGVMWGNGGEIAGFQNSFENTEDGTRQAAVVINAVPAPEAVEEQQGQTLDLALVHALRRGGPVRLR
jgi:D-alanyl-D-alanine carboxypeptidase